ncbi:MAG: hypothetical protein DRI61_01560, partial [Chloroflexi bacterium]
NPLIQHTDVFTNRATGGHGGGIYIKDGEPVIQYSHVYSCTAYSRGGGIHIAGGSPEIRQTSIYTNNATYGGGLSVRGGGTIRLEADRIYQNASAQEGGGIILDASVNVNIRNSLIYSNTAGQGGGGIFIGSGAMVLLENSEIHHNTSGYDKESGGGIAIRQGTVTIRRNKIYENIAASGEGGGISIGKDNGAVKGTIEANEIYSNTAQTDGGGLYVNIRAQNTITLVNNLIYRNSAGSSNDGGGIWVNDGGTGIIWNNTVYSNTAGTGGGIYINGGVPSISNTLVISNYAPLGGGITSTVPVTVYYNDSWGNSDCQYCANVIASTGCITQNPRFVDPLAFDLRLQSNSPAVDAGDPNTTVEEDYEGKARPFGSRADMGAYELYVGTCFARIWDGAEYSRVYSDVQQAIWDASEGDTVKVAGTCRRTFTLTIGAETITQTLYISKGIHLRGGYTTTEWAQQTTYATLDAQGEGRALYISTTSPVTVEGFLVKNGSAISGAGLYVVTGTPVVRNIVFYSNTAEYGGGIYVANGAARIYNDTVISNTATVTGGGLYIASGSPLISNTIVVSNSGGGITAASSLAVHYSNVWGNEGCDACGPVSLGAGSIQTNPLFVDFAGGDFHLEPRSPCIQATTTGPGYDFEGDSRPQPDQADCGPGTVGCYDIGADEALLYPGIRFTPDPIQEKPGFPGDVTTFNNYLTNTGTITDTFYITHSFTISSANPVTQGWVVNYPSAITLTGGEAAGVPLSVTVPSKAYSDTYFLLWVTASSNLRPVMSETIHLTVTVNWQPGVEASPLYTENVNPGTLITYTHLITNAGNAPDTFHMAIISSTKGWAWITPTQVTLESFQTTTLIITVSVPLTSPGSTIERTIVEISSPFAVSKGYSNVRTILTDTTAVNHSPGVRYVATEVITATDVDNNCRDYAHPCKTIAYALGQAVSGDTVKIGKGTYEEYGLLINKDITLIGGYTGGVTITDWIAPIHSTVIDAKGQGRVLHIFGANATVRNITFRNGRVSGSGGGIFIEYGSPHLRSVKVIDGYAAICGGGIASRNASPIIANSVLSNNVAYRGGGFCSEGGSPSLRAIWIYSSTATSRGGGIYLDGGAPELENAVVYSNTTGGQGGGLYVNSGSPLVLHAVFYGNSAQDAGGGIYIVAGTPGITNTVIASNSAPVGSGIYAAGGAPVLDYNDVWANSSNIPTGTHSFSADPLFSNPSEGDFHLQESSPCVDAGITTTLDVDFEDHHRPLPPQGFPDIGADEFLRVGADLEPPRQLTGGSDEYVHISHFITNTGNYTDTFVLTWYNDLGGDLGCTSGCEGQGKNLVTLGAGSSRIITFSLLIPKDALSGTIGTVNITATSSLDSSIFDIITDTITVTRKIAVDIAPNLMTRLKSDPSDYIDIAYTHYLTNTGNYTDSFTLNAISSNGWTVTLSITETGPLSPNQKIPIRITVTVPPTEPLCSNLMVDRLYITATSQTDPGARDSVHDTTVANQCVGVEMEPDRHIYAVPEQVLYPTHTLTNTGNYVDVFDLDWEQELDWGVNCRNCQDLDEDGVFDEFELDTGAAQNVVFEVKVPKSIISGAVNVITITARSTCFYNRPFSPCDVITGASRRATATEIITIEFNAQPLLEPDFVTDTYGFGDVVTFTHVLTNNGNYTDTFDLSIGDFVTAGCCIGWVSPAITPTSATLASARVTSQAVTTTLVTVTMQLPSDFTCTAGCVSCTAWITPVAMSWGEPVADTALDVIKIWPTGTLAPDNIGLVNPADTITYIHTLTNTGPVSHVFLITYTDWISPAGDFTVTIEPLNQPITIEAGATRKVTVTVEAGQWVLSNTQHTLLLTLTSNCADYGLSGVVFDTAVDTTTVRYRALAELAPDNTAVITPGTWFTYYHTLTNTGNFTETFDLYVHPLFVYAYVSPGVVQLGLGETETIKVRVFVPESAAYGQTDRTEVIAVPRYAPEPRESFQAVALDTTVAGHVTGTRYVLLGGTDEQNNCTNPSAPCRSVGWAVYQATSGDEIWVAQGHYTFTEPITVDKSVRVLGGFAPDWSARSPRLHPTILDALKQSRVFYIGGGESPLIEGLVISGGLASDYGGGMYIGSGAEPTVTNNVFQYNDAAYGGGLYYKGGAQPLIKGNVFYSNTASLFGAGLYLEGGNARVWNNVIYKNRAEQRGGGIYIYAGSPSIWNDTIYSNTSGTGVQGYSYGGGLYNYNATPSISNTAVINNAGYGIYSDGGVPTLAYNNAIDNTPANYYGVSPGTGTITATPEFINPEAGDFRLWGDSPMINAGDPNATLPDDDFGGNPRPLLGRFDMGAFEYTLEYTKTVITQTAPAFSTTAWPGQLVTCVIAITNTGNQIWPDAVLTDVLHEYLNFIPGSLTYTVGNGEYLTSSRVISWTGPVYTDNSTLITFTTRITDWLAPGLIITDVAWVNHSRTDEVTLTITSKPGSRHVAQVSQATDVDNNCLAPWKPCRTIQYAVDKALPGDSVLVALGVYTGAGAVVTVTKSINLIGGYTPTLSQAISQWPPANYDPVAHPTYLDGQNSGRVAVITGPVNVTLAGFHIISGSASLGGGVYIYTATAAITRCEVYSNAAQDYGGGIYLESGSLRIDRSRIYSNTAEFGAGVAVTASGSITFVNTLLAHNETASAGQGGGLYMASGQATLIHNTIARNERWGLVISSTAVLTNNIFYSHTVAVSVTAGAQARLWNTLWHNNVYSVAGPGTVVSQTNVFGNPNFVAPDDLDYHLKGGSPAQEKGASTDVTEDYDGEVRPKLAWPDIGYDEFGLEVRKEVTSSVEPGGLLTYTILMRGDAPDARITDTLNITYMQYISVTCTTGSCGYLSPAHAITWTGDIVTDTYHYITFTVKITDWLAAGVVVTNSAVLSTTDGIFDINTVQTVIEAVPGTRYVATTPQATDVENNCLVTWKPCRTLQHTVDQALDGDTLKVASGTYTGTVSISETLTLLAGFGAGDWNNRDFVSNPVTVTGESVRRVFYITSPVTVTLDGFRITAGKASGEDGGGIYVYTATLNLFNARVFANQTTTGGKGGGVYLEGSNAFITNTLIYTNTASGSGGGLYAVGGRVMISNSRVYSNTTGSGASGGGLFISRTEEISLTASWIYTNTADSNGGGLELYKCDRATIRGNYLLDNLAEAGKGGGIAIIGDGSVITLTNNIIARNRAALQGDGVYGSIPVGGSASTAYLYHNTLAENAEEGILLRGLLNNNFTFILTDTAVVSHTYGITVSANAVVTAHNTLWWGNTEDITGTGAYTHIASVYGNPSFLAPETMDYHIRGDSAAIGAGVWAGVNTDIDGETRPTDPDIGADQYPLRVGRWAVPLNPAPCQTVTHTLALTNVIGAPLTSVRVTDTLPISVTYNAGSLAYPNGSGGYLEAQRAITWMGSVPAQSNVYITYTVNITPYLINGTVLTFTASFSDSASVFSGKPLTLTVRTITATVQKEGEGAVSPQGKATIGEVITYTILYTVPKGHVAYEPTVVDELPRLITASGGISTTPALTYVLGSLSVVGASARNEEISADGGTITWTLNTVTAPCTGPKVVTLTFNAQVLNLSDNTAGDLLTNTTTISYTETYSTGPAHIISTTQVLALAEPGIALAHTAAMTEGLGMNDLVLITITLTNTGGVALYDVVVTDTLEGDWTVSDTGSPVFTRTIQAIDANASRDITFTARVSELVEPAAILTATAEVQGTSLPGAGAQERVYTATQAITATTGYPDLGIIKFGPPVRSPGQQITYTIVYSNAGVVRAVGVKVTDTLPLSVTDVISTTSAPASVEQAGNVITWVLSAPVSRTVEGFIRITATVEMTAPAGGVFTNTFGITTASLEQDTANNTGFITTEVKMPSLSISKTPEPSKVPPGGVLTYTLVISNSGEGDATSVLITDSVPISTAYRSCLGGDGCGLSAANTVTWTASLIGAGTRLAVTFTVTVSESVEFGSVITNAAYGVTCAQGVITTGSPITIEVAHTYGVILEPDAEGDGKPGEHLGYALTLTNTGNAQDVFTLTVASALNWDVTLKPTP